MSEKVIKNTIKINVLDFINQVNTELFMVINDNQKEENPISEFELLIHKILYMIYGNFYARFEKELFQRANFEAWKYGPVEIDFRRYFDKNKNLSGQEKIKIFSKFNVKLTEEEKDFLFKIVKKTLRFSP